MSRRIDLFHPAVATELMKKLVDNTPIAYCIMDCDFQVYYANESFYRLKGGDCGAMGKGGFPSAVNGDARMVQEALRTRRPHQALRKEVLPDGTTRHIEYHGIPLVGENGEARFALEMHIDRSDEEALCQDNHRIFIGIVEALISILEKKDNYTVTHSRDVAEITLKIGMRLGLDRSALDQLHLAALLHDIGKIYVHDGIINKTTRLAPDEFEALRRHPTASAEMLGRLSYLSEIARIAGHHHERWDGAGYPTGMRGEDIPLGARIVAIADTYDAITSDRAYRSAKGHDDALAEIIRVAGSQLDPVLVREFVAMAGTEYPDRARLIAATDRLAFPFPGAPADTLRTASAGHGSPLPADRNALRAIMGEAFFVKAIMDNSPCHYMILDDDFTLLYVSDSLARLCGLSSEELLGRHCRVIGGMKRDCFEARDGKSFCSTPRNRCAKAGRRSTVEFSFDGKTCCCDAYAVPLEIIDAAGHPCRCTMEILLDRTEIRRRQRALKDDIHDILDTLFDLVVKMDSAVTSNSEDIIQECISFGSYISAMWQRPRPTGTSPFSPDFP